MKTLAGVSFAVLIAIAGIIFLTQSRKVEGENQKVVAWEYKFEYSASEKKANELGLQGWELVAIQSPSTAGFGNNIPTYVFKRERK